MTRRRACYLPTPHLACCRLYLRAFGAPVLPPVSPLQTYNTYLPDMSSACSWPRSTTASDLKPPAPNATLKVGRRRFEKPTSPEEHGGGLAAPFFFLHALMLLLLLLLLLVSRFLRGWLRRRKRQLHSRMREGTYRTHNLPLPLGWRPPHPLSDGDGTRRGTPARIPNTHSLLHASTVPSMLRPGFSGLHCPGRGSSCPPGKVEPAAKHSAVSVGTTCESPDLGAQPCVRPGRSAVIAYT